ncbi:PAS/PAC sensor hybrid histidine kinase [Stanieria cyanosphaera PCC 7437]|uniref:Circadian input-output histidine kinase CikA n=1 Tax=Stanieria cyanosphaera (strain ATCC 29371 / PCC 7437) TaxID=111780 RepID=K9XRG2_STAC7|nr:PAS domain-containing protein [Stanieria cyanosphaera]AFZ35205.1 PAS/PAC sensor hybrid histidine kinase [Stanieria cyanosphaera PCC 7437]
MNTQLQQKLNLAAEKGMVIHDADGSIQACNADAEKILGYTAEQLVGSSSFEPPWQTIHQDGSAFPPETHPASITLTTGQPCTNVVMGFYQPNGELIWLLLDSQPLLTGNQTKPYGVIVTFTDISPQKQLQFQQPPLKKISSPSSQASFQRRVLLIEDSQEDRLVYRRYLQTDSIWNYCFYEAESGEEGLELYQQCQPDLILLDYLLPDMDGLEWLSRWQQQTFEQRPPVIVLTGQGDERIAVEFLQQGAADYLVKNQITIDKLNLFVERAIEESKLRTQHQQTVIELQQNQQLLKQITEAIPGIIYLVDTLKQKNLYVNSQILPLLGYSPQQQLQEKNFVVRIMHPEDLARLPFHLQELNQAPIGKVCEFQYRMRHSNGQWRWFSSQDRVLSRTADGRLAQVLGIAQDISDAKHREAERKQIELDLRNSEERLRLATEASNMGMWFWDLVNDQLELTTRCKTLLGIAGDREVTYELFLKTLHPEDRDRIKIAVEECIEKKTYYNVEYRVVWSDGSVHWLVAKGKCFYDQHGKPLRMMGTLQNISGRKQIEKSLRESNRLITTILESMTDAFYALDRNWNFTYVNQEAARKLNKSKDELIGKNIWSEFASLFDTELYSQYHRAFNQQVTTRFEYYYSALASWFEISVYPSKQALSVYFRDISERKLAEKKLQENQKILKFALSGAKAGLWDWDIKSETLIWSQENYDLYGIDPNRQPLQYQDWESTLHPEDLERTNAEVQKVFNHESSEFRSEFRIFHPQQGIRWLLGLGNVTTDEQGEPIRFSGINIDISDRKQIEQELQQQTEKLIEANRIKDEFLAIVSHELRTPLNPILGWSQLLAMGKLDSEQTANGLETIHRNAKLQAQLIEDLLDVSRILRGKINLENTLVDLELVIRSAIATMQLAAEAKSIKIISTFAPNNEPVLGDPGRLQQIVWNLLSNAIKFTPEAGQVSIQLTTTSTYAQIQVQDTGKGIEPDFLPYVFELFRQAESSTIRKFGGLGLGLAIVRYLTELHGGTVQADSLGEGQGATFTVRIPIKAKTSKTPNTVSQPNSILNLKGIKVLVVDDEKDSQDLLAFILQQQGAKVTKVGSANDALIAITKSTPDLLISDIGMPEIDGYMLMRQLRQMPQGKELIAIALTAYAGESDRQQALAAGYQAHLPKPINLTELIKLTTQLMQLN